MPDQKAAQQKALSIIGEMLTNMVIHQSTYNPELDAADVVTMLSTSLTTQSSEWDILKNVVVSDLRRIQEEVVAFLKTLFVKNGTVFNYATVDSNFSIWLQYSE